MADIEYEARIHDLEEICRVKDDELFKEKMRVKELTEELDCWRDGYIIAECHQECIDRLNELVNEKQKIIRELKSALESK